MQIDSQNEPLVLYFSAEVITAKKSLIRRYYQMTRFVTPLLLLATLLPAILLWDKISPFWLLSVTLLIPIHFWLIHLFIAKFLYQKSLEEEKVTKVMITNAFISVETTTGVAHLYEYPEVYQMKVISGGIQRPWHSLWASDKNYISEIAFKHKQHNIGIPFIMFSEYQYQQLKQAIIFWSQNQISASFYETQGDLPIRDM